MTEPRPTASTINDAQLDELYARAEQAEAMLGQVAALGSDLFTAGTPGPERETGRKILTALSRPRTAPGDHCGHHILGAFDRPLGPCLREPNHPELFHRDANGTEWRPTHAALTPTKEQPMSACTATIEGPTVPDDGPVQCTREAGHPANHVGPKEAYGELLWNDHNAGAVPHRADSGEQH